LDTMLETWTEIERRKQSLLVRVRLVGDDSSGPRLCRQAGR
jgi:hypothetical protein